VSRVNLDNSQTRQRLSALKKKAATPTMCHTLEQWSGKGFRPAESGFLNLSSTLNINQCNYTKALQMTLLIAQRPHEYSNNHGSGFCRCNSDKTAFIVQDGIEAKKCGFRNIPVDFQHCSLVIVSRTISSRLLDDYTPLADCYFSQAGYSHPQKSNQPQHTKSFLMAQ